MAKFNELKDAEALDRLADLIDPLSRILTNEKVKEAAEKSRMHAVKTALKVCGEDVIETLAIYDGVPVEDFHCSGMGAIARVMAILNDPDINTVFQSSGQKEEK